MALIDEHPIPVPEGFAVMSDRTGSILEKVLDALVRQDVHAARQVLAADDEIDMLYQGLIEDLKHIIRTDPEHLDAIVLMFSVARYLERWPTTPQHRRRRDTWWKERSAGTRSPTHRPGSSTRRVAEVDGGVPRRTSGGTSSCPSHGVGHSASRRLAYGERPRRFAHGERRQRLQPGPGRITYLTVTVVVGDTDVPCWK